MKDELPPDPRETEDHPRRQLNLIGHKGAEAQLRAAHASGRLHHGWLLTGPRGIGKATLAFRFARFLLKYPDPARLPSGNTLAVPGEDPVAKLVGAGSHPDLFSLQRFWDAKNERLQAETSVAEARKAETFFGRTAAYGGWRVCVVDAADDLNENAANALLKTLEEPPPRSIFLLINHAPGAILRTIRSRCIRLDLQALSRPETVDAIRGTEAGRGLSPEEVTSLAALSEGSPGRALELADSMGAKAFERFLALRLPAEPSGAYELAEMLAARGQDDDFRLFSELLLSHVAGRARMEAEKGGMSAGAWAEAHGQIGHSLRVANGLNLDRRQLVLDLLKILGDAAKS